jgi:hypothetical protein
MSRVTFVFFASLLAVLRPAHAQPGIEGYWGYSDIKVRLSTPAIIHTATLDLSPRYYEADTIPPKSSELMNLGQQLTERTQALGYALAGKSPAERKRVLEAYVRLNLRCFGDDYALGKAKIFRLPGNEDIYVVAPHYLERYGRFAEAGMYDAAERSRLRRETPGVEIADAAIEDDQLILKPNLPKAFALHLDIISGEEVGDAAIRETLRACDAVEPRRNVIANYLRYNLARRLIAAGTAGTVYPYVNGPNVAQACLIEARFLLEQVRSESGLLRTAALHKMADVEITRFRLSHESRDEILHLEEGLRLLRLCKEEGDPTAAGSIASTVRNLRSVAYRLSYADLSAYPETRTALACYVNLPDRTSKLRSAPEQLRAEAAWIEKLESLGLRNDAAFVRLAAGFHDAGDKESCGRVLALCPPGDGIVQLMRAHFALERNDRTAAMEHFRMAEVDLRAKANRHFAVISEHFEYGLNDETKRMYGRVLVEQASLLMLAGDFLGAARKLRLSGMDLFNQAYVQGCLLTTQELHELAEEENPQVRYVFQYGWNNAEEKGPMARRDASGVSFQDDIDGVYYSSARATLARRLLQEGRFREALRYWEWNSLPDARAYVEQMTVATDASKPQQERGLAYWHAAMILRENPSLWSCPSGHELVDGVFIPRNAMANRASSKDLSKVGAAEHARIEAAKQWTSPRNSSFRYGVAEHCQKAAELLQGEQSAYVLWFGALCLAYIDHEAAEPMRQKLLHGYGTTKIGRQAIAAKGLPKHVEAPEMK